MINKKGILPLIPLIIIIGAILVFVTAVAFVEQIKYVVLFVSLMIVLFWFLKDGKLSGNDYIGIIVIMGIGAFFLFGGFGLLEQTSFTPLSISSATYNDGTQKILINVIAQGANALKIDFTPSALNGFLQNQGVKATSSSTLTAEVLDTYLSFPYVTNEDNPIEKPVKKGQVFNALGSPIGECRQSFPTTQIAVRTINNQLINGYFDCYAYENIGFINEFPTGITQTNTKIEFDLDGNKKIVDASNLQVTYPGVIINWQSNAVGNVIVTNPSYQLYRLGNDITVVRPNADQEQNNDFNSFKGCVDDNSYSVYDGVMIKSEFTQCNNIYENDLSGTLIQKRQEYIDNTPNALFIDTIANGKMRVKFERPIYTPQFTIELDASKVSIVKLAGVPQIQNKVGNQCFSDVSLDGSGAGKKKMKVKNIGDEDGFFLFDITSSSGFECSVSPISINKGQSKSFDVFYSGAVTSTEDAQGSCTIKVKDQNEPTNSDTCKVDITVEYNSFTSECTGSESICSGDSVLTCVDGFYEAELCSNGCSEEIGGVICIADLGVTTGTTTGAISEECGFGQISSTETEIIGKGPLGIGKWFGLTEEITTEKCVTSGWIIWVIFGSVVMVLGITFILVNKRRR